MTVCTLSKNLLLARANVLTTLMGAGGSLAVYDGQQPASPEIPVPSTCTLLVTLQAENAAFAGPATPSGVSGLVGGTGGAGIQPESGLLELAFSGDGTGAAGVAVVASGAIARLIVTAPGSGYTAPPTVSYPANAGSLPPLPTALIGVVLAANPLKPGTAVAAGAPTWARLNSAAGVALIDIDVGGDGQDVALSISPALLTVGVTVTARSALFTEG